MYNKKLLGKRIKKVRGQKSQEVFAAELGISRGALSFYENGERTPDAEIIYKICELYNISADYLLGFTDNKTTDENLQAVCDYVGLSENAVAVLHEISLGQANYAPIQSWIIFEGYLPHIALLLYDLEKETQQFLKLEKETRQTLLEEAQKRKTRIISEKLLFDQAKSIVDDALRCDTFRYQLIKITEKMANHFDQREQVQNNGKHNPPKE